MGITQSTPAASGLQTCLDAVCAGRADCVAYSPPAADLLAQTRYQLDWVRPYNLAVPVSPAAVVRPQSPADVAAAVRCAADAGLAVQARSGGHSYANFALGGGDSDSDSDGNGTVTIDMALLADIALDPATGLATIGAGATLGNVTKTLAAAPGGGRAFAHGVCPGVGLGGHATVGGLGPMSRMWGTCLDHVVAADVVTADGRIVRTSEAEDEHPDLFFAVRGAGASFGVVTAFTVRTHPAPGSVVQSTFDLTLSTDAAALAAAFGTWQALVADPALDRRFGTEFVLSSVGAVVTGTFYGTEAEWQATGIPDRLPGNNNNNSNNNSNATTTIQIKGWLGALAQNAENEAMYLSNVQSSFASKSLAITRANLLPADAVLTLFQQVYGGSNEPAGGLTQPWTIIFDATGGAVADTPRNATAYAHRDAVYFYQSYGVDLLALSVSTTTRRFIDDFHAALLQRLPDNSTAALGTYPGYVDTELATPQQEYYMANLPRLEQIKAVWDPDQVFRNPQSVQPARG